MVAKGSPPAGDEAEHPQSAQPLRRYCFDAERIDQTRTPGPGDRCVLFVAPRGLALTNRASLRIGGVYAEDIM